MKELSNDLSAEDKMLVKAFVEGLVNKSAFNSESAQEIIDSCEEVY